jgi:hypothetical protein
MATEARIEHLSYLARADGRQDRYYRKALAARAVQTIRFLIALAQRT